MKNRTILVTGGNRGIGLAIVEGLAQNKSDTILLGCRNFRDGEAQAEKIGENVHAVALDLSDRAKLSEQIENIKKAHARVDVLINNAGVLHEGDIFSAKIQDVEDSLQVNTLSAVVLIREFASSMLQNNYGRIVNMSSGWGSFEDGLTGPFAYSLSKAAMNAMTLSAAQKLSGNVKINSMCPGWVRTRMGGMMAERSPEKGAETAIWLANLTEDGPSGGFYRDMKLIEW